MSVIDGKDAKTRKSHPIFSGVLAYFPDALLAVAELSKIGNDQHNPGQPLHWSRGKSNDHADCLVRHQIDAGGVDTDGVRHSAKVAWRALAQLQLEIEADAPKIMSTSEVQAEVDKMLGVDTFKAGPEFLVGDIVTDIADGIHGIIEEFQCGLSGEPGAHVRWLLVGLRIWYPLSCLKVTGRQ